MVAQDFRAVEKAALWFELLSVGCRSCNPQWPCKRRVVIIQICSDVTFWPLQCDNKGQTTYRNNDTKDKDWKKRFFRQAPRVFIGPRRGGCRRRWRGTVGVCTRAVFPDVIICVGAVRAAALSVEQSAIDAVGHVVHDVADGVIVRLSVHGVCVGMCLGGVQRVVYGTVKQPVTRNLVVWGKSRHHGGAGRRCGRRCPGGAGLWCRSGAGRRCRRRCLGGRRCRRRCHGGAGLWCVGAGR